MPRLPPSRSLAALLAALLLATAARPARAQAAEPPVATQPPASDSPQQQLADLAARHQAALDATDGPAILATGRTLGAFALRLAGDLYRPAHPARAAELYTESLSVEDTPATHLDLALTQLAAGKPDQASAEVARLIAAAGDTPRLHLLLASAHHGADDLPGTIAELTRALALDPSLAPAHLALGDAFLELNDFQYNADSLREFTAAQHLDPAGYLTNLALGSMLSQYQRFPEAAPFLAQAAAANPASPDPWLQIGMNAYAADDAPAAITALDTCVTLTGADQAHNNYQVRRVYAVLSRLRADAGDAPAAAALAGRAGQLHAELLRTAVSSTLSESTGLLVNNAPRTAGAHPADTAPLSAAQQQLARQLLGIVATSLNDAGTALARDHDYAAALPLFRQAALADSALAPAARNLGLAAFHTAHYDEAISALTRALTLQPDDTLAQNYLEQSRALSAAAPHP